MKGIKFHFILSYIQNILPVAFLVSVINRQVPIAADQSTGTSSEVVAIARTTSAASSVPAEEPSDTEESSDNEMSSSAEELMDFHQPTDHPFIGLIFTSWKEVTNAVQCAALKENKQVSCTAALSGSQKKVYKCVHWLGCLKRHKQRILDLACDKYPADDHMRAEFIKLNPFGGQGACGYSVVAHWNQSKGFHINTTLSNLSHNRYYTVIHAFACTFALVMY